MSKYVALLRAVNLGGNSAIQMERLRSLFADLGYSDVQTLLQSGNVVFSGGKQSAEKMELSLEKEAATRLSLATVFFIRSDTEWQAVIENNPFSDEAKRDPSHLLVLFLKKEPGKTAVTALQSAIKGPEQVRAVGRQAYIVYPAGIGRSKLTPSLLGKHIGIGTARNWNTVMKVAAVIKK